MLLMIDNYDSFTYNLVQYFGELGEDVRVYRNDEITVEQVEDYAWRKGWDVQTAEKWLAPNLGYSS